MEGWRQGEGNKGRRTRGAEQGEGNKEIGGDKGMRRGTREGSLD